VEVIRTQQFLPQELILLERKRSGEMLGLWREVFSTNEIGRQGMTIGD
jgi:hypothetical protein